VLGKFQKTSWVWAYFFLLFWERTGLLGAGLLIWKLGFQMGMELFEKRALQPVFLYERGDLE